MGSPTDELGRESDETQYTVTLTESFYMQTTEVIQGQWEYAARAGFDKAFANGDISDETTDPILDVMAWYASNSNSTTHAVAQKQANA